MKTCGYRLSPRIGSMQGSPTPWKASLAVPRSWDFRWVFLDTPERVEKPWEKWRTKDGESQHQKTNPKMILKWIEIMN